MQNSQAFLYNNKGQTESQIMSEIPFTHSTKRIIIPRNTAKKKGEGPLQGRLQITAQGNQNTHEWKDIPCSWIL